MRITIATPRVRCYALTWALQLTWEWLKEGAGGRVGGYYCGSTGKWSFSKLDAANDWSVCLRFSWRSLAAEEQGNERNTMPGTLS